MENPPEQTLNIHFMDGSTVKISYPTQTADRYQRKLMIDELSKKRMLMIDGDGGIFFIPLENIKYMSVYPAAEHADFGVIKGAHFSGGMDVVREASNVLGTRNASRRILG